MNLSTHLLKSAKPSKKGPEAYFVFDFELEDGEEDLIETESIKLKVFMLPLASSFLMGFDEEIPIPRREFQTKLSLEVTLQNLAEIAALLQHIDSVLVSLSLDDVSRYFALKEVKSLSFLETDAHPLLSRPFISDDLFTGGD